MKCLIPFSSVEELAPVFDRGGTLVLGKLVIHSGYYIPPKDGQPWEIGLRGLTSSLPDVQETIVHEFLHAFDHYQRNWLPYPTRSEHFFHEVSVERWDIKILKRDPLFAEKILREIILHPLCSIRHAREVRAGIVWEYCRDIARKVMGEIQGNPSVYTPEQNAKFVRLAAELKL